MSLKYLRNKCTRFIHTKVETSETVFAFFIKLSEKYSGDVFVTSVSNAPCGGGLNRKKTLVLNCENDLVKNLAYEKHKTF